MKKISLLFILFLLPFSCHADVVYGNFTLHTDGSVTYNNPNGFNTNIKTYYNGGSAYFDSCPTAPYTPGDNFFATGSPELGTYTITNGTGVQLQDNDSDCSPLSNGIFTIATGCIDPLALNYDSSANVADNASCTYASSTPSGAYNGPTFYDWLFMNAIIICLLAFWPLSFFFKPFEKPINDKIA